MPVSNERVLEAALAIAEAPGLHMDPDDLLEDAYLLALGFPDEEEFMAATASTVRAITALSARKVTPSPLKHGFEGWYSYHYQHRIAQGGAANCRIIFRELTEGIVVKGFGHRRIPKDIYTRMTDSRSDQ